MSTPITRALDKTYLPAAFDYVGYTPTVSAYNVMINEHIAENSERVSAIRNSDINCPHTNALINAQHSPDFWDIFQSILELHEFNFCRTCNG